MAKRCKLVNLQGVYSKCRCPWFLWCCAEPCPRLAAVTPGSAALPPWPCSEKANLSQGLTSNPVFHRSTLQAASSRLSEQWHCSLAFPQPRHWSRERWPRRCCAGAERRARPAPSKCQGGGEGSAPSGRRCTHVHADSCKDIRKCSLAWLGCRRCHGDRVSVPGELEAISDAAQVCDANLFVMHFFSDAGGKPVPVFISLQLRITPSLLVPRSDGKCPSHETPFGTSPDQLSSSSLQTLECKTLGC